jgi:hypothetical protein
VRRGFAYRLTGLLSWSLILLSVAGVALFPRPWLAVTVLFLAIFLCRTIVVLVFAVVGEVRCRRWDRVDWTAGESEAGPFAIAPADVHHIVLVPAYKEPVPVLERTLDALAAQHRASERLIVALGMEEREPGAWSKGRALAEDYAEAFHRVVVTVHPAGLSGEVAGKSSNEAWAASVASRVAVHGLGIDRDLLTITSCDADSVLHSSYFAAVSRLYAADADRHSRFWHAPMQYYNNLWRVPAPVRFVTWFGHAWMRASLAMPFYTPPPVSTYTLSLRMAEECGGWDPSVISEDWHMFLQCFFARSERIGLTPVYLPTDADAPEADSWRASMRTAFQQAMRHAWGAEDVGYVITQIRRRGATPRSVSRGLQVLSDHVLRGAGWFLVMGAYLLAAGVHPRYAGLLDGTFLDVGPQARMLVPLFGLGALAMVATIAFEMTRRPIPPEVSRVRLAAEQAVMWMCLPLLGMYLGMLPAMHAQTMQLLGLPLAYKVTPKRVHAKGSHLPGARSSIAPEAAASDAASASQSTPAPAPGDAA